MTQENSDRRTGHYNQISPRHITRGLLIALIFVGASIFILVYQFSPLEDNIIDLKRGDFAPYDILAPQQFSYTSDIQTEEERERVRESVPTFYSQPDPKVAQQQVDRLRKIFDFFETVRADPYGSIAEKSDWVAAIPDLELSDSVVDTILYNVNEQDWPETRQEALAVLNQAMQTEIKEKEVSATRRRLPTLVRLSTPDEHRDAIVDITGDLIKPNTFPDEVRTEAEREAAVASVKSVEITVEKNELIIAAGKVVGSKEEEKLEVLRSLQQPKSNWFEDVITPASLMLMITIITSIYLLQYTPRILADGRRLILLTALLLTFIAIAKFMIPSGTEFAYMYPIAALSMIVVTVIDVQLVFILTTVLAFLAGSIATDNSQAIVVYLILSGWTGALALSRGQRVNNLLWAFVYVGIVNTGAILIFNLPAIDMTNSGILLLLEGMLNGIFSVGLALLGLFIIGNLAGVTTSIQLLDLSRPTHPLQRQLLLKAPGSYQHSLMVGNLAEQAAERVGANALLVRVMAYYHDVGKIQRPYFFIENQREGVNVHEKLEPQISAQIIISHVKDGLDLTRKYKLPQVIRDGIAQHHGTSQVKYFYHQALKAAEEKHTHVGEANFRYLGPIPQTREAGILMLADVSETTVRALKPNSPEEIDDIVYRAITNKLSTGQLNECELTVADLHIIRTAFVDILQGVHHPRIKYPGQSKNEDNEPQEDDSEGEQMSQRTPPSETTPGANTPPPVAAPSPLQSLPAEAQPQPSHLIRRE